jgi:hypothetical protein
MAGAFVAVANDSSATWWNPSGLAAGPFLDIALARVVSTDDDQIPAYHGRVTSFALGTPPFGFSYYRLRITEISPSTSTGSGPAGREEEEADLPVRSLSVHQIGATILQTVLPGVHVGTTLKYLRGTVAAGTGDAGPPVSELLDIAADLPGGPAESRFDLDAGVLAVAGPVRVGAMVRNIREPEFDAMRLPRQVRIGAAFDAEAAGSVPLIVALDGDVTRYRTPTGERRVIALGAEQWVLGRRIGLRAGARFNTVDRKERTATGGVSVAVRSGLYLDGHIAGSDNAGEAGWGAAVRVSF